MPTTPPPNALPQGVLRLSDWGLIRAAGADAHGFLHGQLTQDIQGLRPGQARLAGYCSAKGRLLATFIVWPLSGDELALACSADLLPAMVKRLSMFVLRAKCRLSDASADVALWGVVGPDAALGEVGQVQTDGPRQQLRLPDAWVDGIRVARALVATPAASALHGPTLDPDVWRALEVRAGVPRIVSATSDRFVPQMVNLELVGGVHFQKGCYPGQEVVARSQYRGTLKRRAFALRAGVPMSPGQQIFHSTDPGQPAGEVVLAGSLQPGVTEALAELKLGAVDNGTLHLDSADGPLLVLTELPYALPTGATA